MTGWKATHEAIAADRQRLEAYYRPVDRGGDHPPGLHLGLLAHSLPGWRAIPRSDWPWFGDNVRIGTYSAIIGAVTVGSDTLINVQVVSRTDLADGHSVVVRPNWRLQRKSKAAEVASVGAASLEL
jgi:hypothetical protein